jgi:PPOX class probable F420-dependent enzyme
MSIRRGSPSEGQEANVQATPEQQAFLEQHRLVVVGIGRASGPPHVSPVYYVMDGEDVLISTTAARFKARAIRRNEDVSLCVLGEQFPFPYLGIYGKGSIEEGGAAAVMRKIGEKMTGSAIPDAAVPAIEARAVNEGRVVLRVRPLKFYSTTPLAQKKDT